MSYFSNLLRQSAARVGPVQERRIHGSAALEVDDVRVVHPRSAPETRTQSAPPAPPPVHAEPERAPAVHETSPPFGERQPDQPKHEASATPPQPVVPVVASAARVDAAAPATVVRRPPVVPSAPTPAHVRHAAPVIESRKSSPADAPPEERALRSVEEVVTWVAAGAEVESPRAGVDTVHALDVSREADEPRRAASAPVPVDAPPGDRDAPPRDAANVTVSVGTIELTVEDPAGTVVPPQAAPPPVASPDASGASASRLSRYYLRP